jgi:hypothetical protein
VALLLAGVCAAVPLGDISGVSPTGIWSFRVASLTHPARMNAKTTRKLNRRGAEERWASGADFVMKMAVNFTLKFLNYYSIATRSMLEVVFSNGGRMILN